MSDIAVPLVLGGAAIAYSAMRIKQDYMDMSHVKSTVDGEKYLVRKAHDEQEAANRLAEVRGSLLRLMKYLKQKQKDHAITMQIVQNFDAAPHRFTESAPDAKYTSYSVNKGEKVFMCLRQRNEKKELVDKNVLVFVALHEMAHIGTKEVGHTQTFWNNFAWLLKQAESIGVYQFQDFAAHPVEYCGISITDQPKWKDEH